MRKIYRSCITLTASKIFLSARVCAVSFCVRRIDTFFSTFIAKNVFISRPLVFRTYRSGKNKSKIITKLTISTTKKTKKNAEI